MHIAALLALRDRKVMPLKSGQRLNADPLKSQALNLRIAQLWENPAPDGHKRSWPEVASEVGAGLTASSARNRYLRYQAQQQEHLRGEAYRALSGRAEPLDDEPEGRSILSHIKDARDPLPTIRNSLIVEPESSDEGAMSGDTPPPSQAPPEKPAAPKTDLPPIGPKSNRREIDEFMWSLWNHGKGKTPDKISDILCEKGFSYGTKSVERRLRQQGGDL
jgi:hypothetical protein